MCDCPLAAEAPVHCEVYVTLVIIVFVQTCHNTYCEVLFSSSLLVAQTLKYSAHRFKLIQKERIQNRESALFIVLRLFSSNFVRQPASATICCLLFLTLFLFPISPPPVSVILFSGADSEESAVEQDVRGKKSLCAVTFACHWDKIDEMLCLASDLNPGSQMGAERSPCQNRG